MMIPKINLMKARQKNLRKFGEKWVQYIVTREDYYILLILDRLTKRKK